MITKFRSLFYILLLIPCLLQIIEVLAVNIQATKCNDTGPEIRFPFWVSARHPETYPPLPGFRLFCDGNTTSIHFASYGNLLVKSINYEIGKLDLLDPGSCVHKVFLNLDLTLTPFRYYYRVRPYTYLNCSTRLSPPFEQVLCMSGSRHHVYTVDPSLRVPASCRVVKTTAIPLAYSSYLSDSSFGLGLTWSFPLYQKVLKPEEERVGLGNTRESKQQDTSI